VHTVDKQGSNLICKSFRKTDILLSFERSFKIAWVASEHFKKATSDTIIMGHKNKLAILALLDR